MGRNLESQPGGHMFRLKKQKLQNMILNIMNHYKNKNDAQRTLVSSTIIYSWR
jgi:hypothetical protein